MFLFPLCLQFNLEMKEDVQGNVQLAKRVIEEEEATDSDLRCWRMAGGEAGESLAPMYRQKFGVRWTRSLSSTINEPLKKDMKEIEKQLKLAADADEIVRGQ